MKHFEFEYGEGTMGANLPDTTDVFIPGVTVDDPPCISEKELEAVYKESLNHPIGMPAIKELVHREARLRLLCRTESKVESRQPAIVSWQSSISFRIYMKQVWSIKIF